MKTRKEYEDICDKTFALAGDAQAYRIQIDLLLDIRDLLTWFRDNEMLKQIVEERKRAAMERITTLTGNY